MKSFEIHMQKLTSVDIGYYATQFCAVWKLEIRTIWIIIHGSDSVTIIKAETHIRKCHANFVCIILVDSIVTIYSPIWWTLAFWVWRAHFQKIKDIFKMFCNVCKMIVLGMWDLICSPNGLCDCSNYKKTILNKMMTNSALVVGYYTCERVFFRRHSYASETWKQTIISNIWNMKHFV